MWLCVSPGRFSGAHSGRRILRSGGTLVKRLEIPHALDTPSTLSVCSLCEEQEDAVNPER